MPFILYYSLKLMLVYKGKEAELKKQITLLALGSTCKELGSHYPILTTSKKLKSVKKQQLFLDPEEKGRHRVNHCPLDWRANRQTQGVVAYHKNNSKAETAKGTSAGTGHCEL